MKKIIVTLFLSTLLINFSFGQGAYFRAGGGYGFPMASQVIGTNYLRTQPANGSDTYSEESVKASYGAGMNISLGGGYMFNENIGFDLGIVYQKSKKNETSDINLEIGFGKEEDIITYQSTALFINPAFFITSAKGSKTPYGKFGILAGSPKIKTVESYYYDLDGTYTQHNEWETRKGIALGLQGTVGVNWMLTDKLDLFTEISFLSMSFYAKERELTVITYNGVDAMPNQQPYQKLTEFKKKLDPNAAFDANKPWQALQEASAYSALTFNVGIRYLLKGRMVN
ncbi:MAG: outer membrane beta-barrel protein [Cyclobacteriaceae bacterium]|nr:outer membrane beta-barrel protein [Cyclobacteriaceae bacterium]